MQILKAVGLAIVLGSAAVVAANVLAEPARADVSFDFAYSNLSQHGSWMVSGEYGRVWQPREYRRDWNPYYDGHWVDTDMGWTWVSDYEWGAIPYHYGTWALDPRYGWVWIPGEVWAPSWVVFRTGPDHIGWAPVPPGFSVGVSIGFGAPSSFIYVSSRDFLAPRLRTVIIPEARTNVFINNTTVVNNIVIQNNIVVNRGPDVRMVERATGRTISRVPIEHVARVAPFAHVSRAELAVPADKMKHGWRAAEPVPESRPLPASDKHGSPNNQNPKGAPVAAVSQSSAPKGHTSQGESHTQAQNPQQHQQHQAPRPASAPPPPSAKTHSTDQQHAKAQSNAKDKEHAEAPSDAKTQQHAKADPKSDPKATSDPKAKSDSKAKQDHPDKKDQSDKKDHPDKKDDGSGKGTSDQQKNG